MPVQPVMVLSIEMLPTYERLAEVEDVPMAELPSKSLPQSSLFVLSFVAVAALPEHSAAVVAFVAFVALVANGTVIKPVSIPFFVTPILFALSPVPTTIAVTPLVFVT